MMQEKILIADDEPYVLDVCRRILEKNYQVKIVYSGLEAIQLAQYERFDLLLTDIKMPGIDGLETAREIKKINPDIVCITMTGFSTMETAIKALRLGIDEFVIKPFAPEELTLAIERALEKERLRKENIRLRSLLPLFEFNESLMSIVDTRLLMEQVLQLAVKELKADGATLYMVNDQGNLDLVTQKSIPADKIPAINTHCQPILEKAKLANAQLVVTIDEYPEFTESLVAMAVKSLVVTPLGKDKLLGLLLLLKSRHVFSRSECNFLTVMTGQATIAYENARLFEDLQTTYDKLKHLDYLKSEFINIAAHELRTPLAILMGYASVLEEEAAGIQKNYLEIIVRNAMRLRALIEDLLNMQSIENEHLQLNIDIINLPDLIEHAINDISVLARKKNIELKTNFSDALPTIQSDRQKVELIVTNLLANAIKFTPPNGRVWVEGQCHHKIIEISVFDTGIGIPEEEFSKIFDRFYQVESSLNREHDGIGLGLSIVQGMVKRCGGTIRVESELNKGSKFTFTLPLVLAPRLEG